VIGPLRIADEKRRAVPRVEAALGVVDEDVEVALFLIHAGDAGQSASAIRKGSTHGANPAFWRQQRQRVRGSLAVGAEGDAAHHIGMPSLSEGDGKRRAEVSVDDVPPLAGALG
jgi:hypothetical protein